jgi:hypothetical protein
MVVLCNLTLRPDLNGSHGKVESYDVPFRRYFVKLESMVEVVKCAKAEDLLIFTFGHKEVNLTVRTDVNGQCRKSQHYDVHSGRYFMALEKIL